MIIIDSALLCKDSGNINEINELNKDTKIVILTDSNAENSYRNFSRFNVSDILFKPFAPGILMRIIEEIT